ncbi:cytochrome c [Methylovirgula sp. 4M-Z18]|uniref:cytochrome c n=1 Tax=Methylovirgula sp. 4M-Z18 TaxID=2293567 RepID=UPI000E2EA19E|nr:cytochrome c [Methylovirgula sp. 4M-Z18]RFB79622.1 cytochrome c [Methylovirgula sp. 4M-Z18]
MRIVLCTSLSLLLLGTAAYADEARLVLKPGPGADTTGAYCSACHSVDYIMMNSPFHDPKIWDTEVNKMIKVFGAPIEDKDAKEIIDYLKANYTD